MKRVLIGVSQIVVLAIVHSWILIECINFTDAISIAMKESVEIEEIYANPIISTLLLFILLPVFEGAVVGLVFWLIYRKVGIGKVILYIMIGYLIFSFILTLVMNIDYNGKDVAYKILLVIINYIISVTVFVCSILPLTAYGDRFRRFFRKLFEIESVAADEHDK